MSRRALVSATLPPSLAAAYDWTDAAGELAELRDMPDSEAETYCRESAANAAEYDQRDVTEVDLLALARWLRGGL